MLEYVLTVVISVCIAGVMVYLLFKKQKQDNDYDE